MRTFVRSDDWNHPRCWSEPSRYTSATRPLEENTSPGAFPFTPEPQSFTPEPPPFTPEPPTSLDTAPETSAPRPLSVSTSATRPPGEDTPATSRLKAAMTRPPAADTPPVSSPDTSPDTPPVSFAPRPPAAASLARRASRFAHEQPESNQTSRVSVPRTQREESEE